MVRRGSGNFPSTSHAGPAHDPSDTRFPQHGSSAPLRRLRKLSWLLDEAIPIPGTRHRIGLDALIGLVPSLGDMIGTALSLFVVAEALRVGVPAAVFARMVFNIAVETVVGTVPLLGDIFDVAWKANSRNVALLENHLIAEGWEGRDDVEGARHAVRNATFPRWLGVVLLVGLALFLFLFVALSAAGLVLLYQQITG